MTDTIESPGARAGAEPAQAAVNVAAVAVIKKRSYDKGPEVEWLLEGGPYELAHDEVLLVADRPVTDDDGHGEVFLHAPKANPWTPISKALPEAGTECVVLVRGVDGKLFPALDEWEMQRESPVGWTSHTIETGLMWSGHEFEDVVAWMRVPDYAALFDVPVQGSQP